ncbi:6534_t:CDS:1, partial [Paraglomus brasilianum]
LDLQFSHFSYCTSRRYTETMLDDNSFVEEAAYSDYENECNNPFDTSAVHTEGVDGLDEERNA